MIFERVISMIKKDFKSEELCRRTKALTKEQMELVLDNIPVELCLARIARELEKNKIFMNSVQNAIHKIE